MSGTVLLIDSHSDRMAYLQAKLNRSGYCVLPSRTAQTAKQKLQSQIPDCILCSTDLDDHCGYELIFSLRGLPKLGSVPIFLFKRNPKPEDHARAFAAGALALIASPIDITALNHRLPALIRGHRLLAELDLHLPIDALDGLAEAPTIFIAAPRAKTFDGKDIPKSLQKRLKSAGWQNNGTAQCKLASSISALRKYGSGRKPVVFLTDHLDDDLANEALTFGASDVLSINAPLEAVEAALVHQTRLQSERETLKKAIKDAFEDSRIHPVSGAYSRSYAHRYLDRMLHSVTRPETVGLFLFDLDSFKTINDSWGHKAGDAILRNTVNAITGVLRPDSAVFAWGGDEFLVTCPGLPAQHVSCFGDRVLKAIRSVKLPDGSALSASYGATILDMGRKTSASELIETTDAALYDAKLRGKGRGAVA